TQNAEQEIQMDYGLYLMTGVILYQPINQIPQCHTSQLSSGTLDTD
ncbi:unnamed protein product, partial [Caretta caretta]